MKPKHIKLAREQLDDTLKHFRVLRGVATPGKGWIRAIRDVVGMTGEQLAKRLNTNKQRISRIEHDEKLGKVKLETLKNVAKAIDCVFVYSFVPRSSLEEMVRRQAKIVAEKRMTRSNQMMRLEKQELSESEKIKAMQNLIDEIVEKMPKSLWDKNDGI